MANENQSGGQHLWFYLGVATGAQVSTSFITLGIASLIPFLVAAFHLSAAQAGLAGGAANVGMMLMGLPAGTMTDRYGEKKVLVWGCLLAGSSIMLASLSMSFWALYPLLLFTGMWAGSMTPAGSKLIVNWFPAEQLGTAQSIRQTGVTGGGLLAALILPSIALMVNWRLALALAGVPGLLGAAAVRLLYHERPGDPSAGKSRGTLARIVRNRNIRLASCMGMFFLGAQFILLSYLQLFLHATAGIPLARTALFLAVLTMAGLLGRIFWGFLSDFAFGGLRRPALVSAGLLAAVASVSMLLIGPHTPRIVIVGQTFLLGFTALGWNGVNVALFAELAGGRQEAATAVGLGMSAIQFGVLCLTPLFGYLVDRTGTYGPSWVFLAVALLVGCIAAMLVQETGKGRVAPDS